MKKFIISAAVFLVTSYAVTNYSPSVSRAAFGGKAVLGEVSEVADKIITVTQRDGREIKLTTTEVTKFIRPGKKLLLKDVAVGDNIVAVGALSTVDNTFLVKTLVVKPQILKVLQKVAVFGFVSEIGENSFTLTQPRQSDFTEINVTSQTTFRKDGKKTNFEKLTVGQKVIAIVLKEENGELTGRLVVLLGEPPEEAQATPSATE